MTRYEKKGTPTGFETTLRVGDLARVKVDPRFELPNEGRMGEVVARTIVPSYRYNPPLDMWFPDTNKAELRFPDGRVGVYNRTDLTPVRASWRARRHVRRNYIRTGNWLDSGRRRR